MSIDHCQGLAFTQYKNNMVNNNLKINSIAFELNRFLQLYQF